jgi:hypothetical protein
MLVVVEGSVWLSLAISKQVGCVCALESSSVMQHNKVQNAKFRYRSVECIAP